MKIILLFLSFLSGNITKYIILEVLFCGYKLEIWHKSEKIYDFYNFARDRGLGGHMIRNIMKTIKTLEPTMT